jgi:hypothetical protein
MIAGYIDGSDQRWVTHARTHARTRTRTHGAHASIPRDAVGLRRLTVISGSDLTLRDRTLAHARACVGTARARTRTRTHASGLPGTAHRARTRARTHALARMRRITHGLTCIGDVDMDRYGDTCARLARARAHAHARIARAHASRASPHQVRLFADAIYIVDASVGTDTHVRADTHARARASRTRARAPLSTHLGWVDA